MRGYTVFGTIYFLMGGLGTASAEVGEYICCELLVVYGLGCVRVFKSSGATSVSPYHQGDAFVAQNNWGGSKTDHQLSQGISGGDLRNG